jgi:EAL domain-containing protein (putative c-di-GMP-specific phosphodiesterase class I)
LKIDKSFVHQITGDLDDSPIVGAIINMGKSLKQRVIAEGVETEQQLAFLQGQHCLEGQGYLFSQPLPAAQLAHLLQTGIAETVVH